MSRLSAKAIVIGGLAGILTSGLGAVLLVSLVMSRLGTLHSTRSHAHTTVALAMQRSGPVQAAELLLGFGSSVLGGYIAARLSGHDELVNAACSSLICLSVGILSLASGHDSQSLIVQVLILLASPLFGLFGGYLHQLWTRRSSAPNLA
ncbi:hypothetical protein ACPOL_5396 [Acidisarcina polymorpha]|uniref:Uncharacterized protein n=1 Tax=Acidisarcina polymorpha TaxID=2211140 RepID=A0A2Z5G7G2_9BACT|nr:hypothetical protein [Acidisarcina polymorpha]AXC14644.1 hypothetical protein ACPOL_5396 [Acidisarcina polymorpha]